MRPTFWSTLVATCLGPGALALAQPLLWEPAPLAGSRSEQVSGYVIEHELAGDRAGAAARFNAARARDEYSLPTTTVVGSENHGPLAWTAGYLLEPGDPFWRDRLLAYYDLMLSGTGIGLGGNELLGDYLVFTTAASLGVMARAPAHGDSHLANQASRFVQYHLAAMIACSSGGDTLLPGMRNWGLGATPFSINVVWDIARTPAGQPLRIVIEGDEKNPLPNWWLNIWKNMGRGLAVSYGLREPGSGTWVLRNHAVHFRTPLTVYRWGTDNVACRLDERVNHFSNWGLVRGRIHGTAFVDGQHSRARRTQREPTAVVVLDNNGSVLSRTAIPANPGVFRSN